MRFRTTPFAHVVGVAVAAASLILLVCSASATETMRLIRLEAESSSAPTVSSISSGGYTTVVVRGKGVPECCFSCVRKTAFNYQTLSCDTNLDLCEDCIWDCPCMDTGERFGMNWDIQTPTSTPPNYTNTTQGGVNTVVIVAPSSNCFACELDPTEGSLCDGVESPCWACTLSACP